MLSLLTLVACIETEVRKVTEDVPPVDGELEADPELVDFGVLSSGAPVSQTVTLTSVGDGPVTISSIDVSGSSAYTIAWASEETTLQPGESTDVVVTYTTASADDEATLVAWSDAVEEQTVVWLMGAGTYPEIQTDPTVVEYESLYGEPVIETVTITSIGTADLVISDMYLQGTEWFSSDQLAPVTLAPGESTTVDITYTPIVANESASGKLWLTTNTAAGFAVVPLEARYGQPCMGLGEAWDKGLIDAGTGVSSNLVVTNESTDTDLCIDQWYVWRSDESQDLGAGDMDADFGDTYPHGSLTVSPGDNVVFMPDATSDEAWYCMELTQYTSRNADYWFTGAYVPEPLLTYMLATDQDSVWAYQTANPVMLVGREVNYLSMPGGGTAEMSLLIWNMGSVDGETEIRETVPAGYSASGFSIEPTRTETDDAGGTIYVFPISLDAREETDSDQDTDYDEQHITYTLTVPPCEGRQTLTMASSTWTDASGVERIASANPVVIDCDE